MPEPSLNLLSPAPYLEYSFRVDGIEVKGATSLGGVQDYTCHSCGASVAVDAATCEYCSNPISITTFSSVAEMPAPLLNKYIGSYKKGPSSQESSKAIAFCYLKLKIYDKAQQAFEQAVEENFDDSELFFYAAACMLKGKKAFLAPRANIDRAMEYAEGAIMIEPRSIYRYFLAYLKCDFFSRKGYRISPDFKEELEAARADGLAEGDVRQLYELLGVTRPADLQES